MTELKARAADISAEIKTGKAGCLGPEGSFSELAARELCEGYEIVLYRSFAEAVSKLLSREVDYAVLPIENSLNGGVLETLDLLAQEEIFGDEELMLSVDQRIATLEGVREEDIRTVYSHEQALAQCSDYLKAHFPFADFVATKSTSESLSLLDRRSAGIVGAHVKQSGIVLSKENIANYKGNYTRFLRVVRKGELPPVSVMIFFCAVCAHKPGALIGLLKIFQRYGLNLTRIESRPVKEMFGQYRFFIEFVGDIGNERVVKALSEARAYCIQFKLLGAYR